MEWLEVTGRDVDVAVAAGMAELGASSIDEIEVEVLTKPSKGFLGMGRVDAVVKITKKPSSQRRKRRRRKGKGEGRDSGSKAAKPSKKPVKKQADKPAAKPENDRAKAKSVNTGTRQQRSRNDRSQRKPQRPAPDRTEEKPREEAPVSDINEQAQVATAFLEGLVDAFGLEGEVTSKIDDDVLYLDVSGEQTEALVGQKGSIMQAILELTRTVIQRKTHGAPRMRIDIAGYGKRRREALTIYAARLAERVLAEGGEIALEPMNPADRKVIHDAAGEFEGVATFSEGEDPRRAVIITLKEGFEPSSGDSTEEPDEEESD
jgi:spoIIIJ-associated protein